MIFHTFPHDFHSSPSSLQHNRCKYDTHLIINCTFGFSFINNNLLLQNPFPGKWITIKSRKVRTIWSKRHVGRSPRSASFAAPDYVSRYIENLSAHVIPVEQDENIELYHRKPPCSWHSFGTRMYCNYRVRMFSTPFCLQLWCMTSSKSLELKCLIRTFPTFPPALLPDTNPSWFSGRFVGQRLCWWKDGFICTKVTLLLR